MYSGTRFSIARQLAPMQIGIRKAVSTISIRAMPSMPSAQFDAAAKRRLLDELPLRAVGVVLGPEVEARARSRSASPMSAIQRAALRLHEQAQHTRQERDDDQQAEQGKSVHLAHQIAQVAAPIRPSSMTSA